MRGTFMQTLAGLAREHPEIVLLTADLGYCVIEPFADEFPDRFFNVGVAEQNMIGMATGLAEAGFIPFTYSIMPFAILRPYEFIRNGPVFHHLPVRVVGVGGGFEYGTAGHTHYGLEDLAVSRVLPGLHVVAPADFEQTRNALQATWNVPGPVYYRLGKDDTNALPGLDGRFEPGPLNCRSGERVLLLSTGSLSLEASAAAEQLGCAFDVIAGISPAPVDALAERLAGFTHVVTTEEHYHNGGLGSLVAEVIAERGLGCTLLRCAVEDATDGITGSTAFLRDRHGVSAARLVERVTAFLESSAP